MVMRLLVRGWGRLSYQISSPRQIGYYAILLNGGPDSMSCQNVIISCTFRFFPRIGGREMGGGPGLLLSGLHATLHVGSAIYFICSICAAIVVY